MYLRKVNKVMNGLERKIENLKIGFMDFKFITPITQKVTGDSFQN